MKKLLLSFLMLFAIGSFVVDAQTEVFHETFDQCAGTGGNDGVWTGNIGISEIVADNDGWTVENGGAGSKCIKCGTSSKLGVATTPALNFEGNATMVVKAASWSTGDATVLKISITNGTVSPSEITLTPTEFTEYTINITGATNGSQITFEGSTASKERFWIDDVKITASGDVEVTAAPTFTPAAGTYTEAQNVTISAEDGAEIYYTTNGEDPTTSSTRYTEPFEVATTTTVKAIAVLNEVESTVASATYTFPVEVASIAEYLELAENTIVKFNSPVTVTYQYDEGYYTYATDKTGSMLIYGPGKGTLPVYKNGDVIPAGFYGKKAQFRQTPQLTTQIDNSEYSNGSFATEVENSGAIAPVAVTAAEAGNAKYVNCYVMFNDIEISGIETDGEDDDREGELKDASGTFAIYNQFVKELTKFANGSYKNVVGIIANNNATDKFQFLPIEFDATITGIEDAVAGEAVKAIGLDGRIAIIGEAADVEVFNMGGALIAKGNLNEVNCQAGAYIVKVDGNVQKVIVK